MWMLLSCASTGDALVAPWMLDPLIDVSQSAALGWPHLGWLWPTIMEAGALRWLHAPGQVVAHNPASSGPWLLKSVFRHHKFPLREFSL
jgi:hypothetical protein